MKDLRNHHRQYIIEAEGYLELGMAKHALLALAQLDHSENQGIRILSLRGEALRMASRYKEAITALRRAAALSPDDIHLWLGLGWCYKRTRQMNLAIESLNEAVVIEPGSSLIHYNLACYWSLAGNKNQALQYLSTAIDIDSDYRDLLDTESDLDPIREDPEFLALTNVIV